MPARNWEFIRTKFQEAKDDDVRKEGYALTRDDAMRIAGGFTNMVMNLQDWAMQEDVDYTEAPFPAKWFGRKSRDVAEMLSDAIGLKGPLEKKIKDLLTPGGGDYATKEIIKNAEKTALGRVGNMYESKVEAEKQLVQEMGGEELGGELSKIWNLDDPRTVEELEEGGMVRPLTTRGRGVTKKAMNVTQDEILPEMMDSTYGQVMGEIHNQTGVDLSNMPTMGWERLGQRSFYPQTTMVMDKDMFKAQQRRKMNKELTQHTGRYAKEQTGKGFVPNENNYQSLKRNLFINLFQVPSEEGKTLKETVEEKSLTLPEKMTEPIKKWVTGEEWSREEITPHQIMERLPRIGTVALNIYENYEPTWKYDPETWSYHSDKQSWSEDFQKNYNEKLSKPAQAAQDVIEEWSFYWDREGVKNLTPELEADNFAIYLSTMEPYWRDLNEQMAEQGIGRKIESSESFRPLHNFLKKAKTKAKEHSDTIFKGERDFQKVMNNFSSAMNTILETGYVPTLGMNTALSQIFNITERKFQMTDSVRSIIENSDASEARKAQVRSWIVNRAEWGPPESNKVKAMLEGREEIPLG